MYNNFGFYQLYTSENQLRYPYTILSEKSAIKRVKIRLCDDLTKV